MKTKDRILQTSLKLFNERGERNVSTNHIAAALEISPGNLYYYFRNKNEIVYQLFLSYQSQVQQFLSVPSSRPLTYQDKVNYLEAILNSMWDYRFLHRDLQHLLRENEELRVSYQAFVTRSMADSRAVLTSMAESGLLKASPEQVNALVLNIWVMAVSWTSFLQTTMLQDDGDSSLNRDLLKRAIYQIICLEEPYLCDSIQPMLPALKKKYLGSHSSDPLSLFPTLLGSASGSD